MNNNIADSLLSRVNALAEKHWPHIKKPEGSALAWQYRLSDPLPVCWPLHNQRLVFYIFAHALDMHQPTAGETIAGVWAKIITGGDDIIEFISLQSTLIPEGRKGVRPLTGSELQILNTNPIDLFCAPTSAENSRAIRSFYQLQLTLGNIPQTAISQHSDFFDWLDESQKDKT